jgi:N-acetylglutamate synthase-like GNAT family acetyltransferase
VDVDRPRLREQIERDWGSARMATRGRLVNVAALPGFVAEDGGEWLGYVTYELRGKDMEIAVLQSLVPDRGAGSALLAACAAAAGEQEAARIWLVTTNDNVAALRFYQRRGFVLAALHADAVTVARRTLKPEIPMLGMDDIPIRDELELELPAAAWPEFIERYQWPSG